MKNFNLSYWFLIIIFTTTLSCEVVSIDEALPSIIEISEAFPDNAGTLNAALTNESSRSWKITGFKLGSNSNFQSCRLDDALVLNNDGTYNYDGGNELCGSEDNVRLKSEFGK